MCHLNVSYYYTASQVAGNQSETSDVKEAGSVRRSLGREVNIWYMNDVCIPYTMHASLVLGV